MAVERLRVQVAYALPERQWLWLVELDAGARVGDAIQASPFPQRFPEQARETLTVGVFGKLCELDQPLRDGDRIEIYRPLLIDPKQARRQRAQRG